jgi:hypothetical protein
VSKKQYEKLDKVAREIIDAFRDERDADVSNLIVSGLDIDAKGLAYALARRAAPLRFLAPDDQAFYAQRDGDLFGFWLDGQPDRWEASEREFVVPTLGSTLGYEIAHHELRDWMEPPRSACWPTSASITEGLHFRVYAVVLAAALRMPAKDIGALHLLVKLRRFQGFRACGPFGGND